MTTTDRRWLVLGIAGVALYVAGWAVLGLVAPGYDPLRDAISELYDLGTPPWQRTSFAALLVVTGLPLLALAGVLDRVLPGAGRLGPGLVAVAGAGIVAVAFFPCSDGCPPIGTTFTDTMHVVLAGGGYIGLVTAPLAFARRLWHTPWRDVAVAGLVLGGAATAGFVVRNLGVDVLPGLQQRVFNTLADAWYVLVAVVALRRTSTATAGAPASGVASRAPE